MNRITAFAGALLCLLLTIEIADARSRSTGLHPRCNIDWPCETVRHHPKAAINGHTFAVSGDFGTTPKRAQQARRADRYRNVEFGGSLAPGETQRSFLGGRPSGCPARAWCGCWLAKHLGLSESAAMARTALGESRKRRGRASGWRHRGLATSRRKDHRVDGHRIRVLSGNDGRAVMDRWRTTAGVIAYRHAP